MVRVSVLNDTMVSGRDVACSSCIGCRLITDPAQNNIVNAERRGKRQVLVRPSSKVVVKVLSVMQKHGECAIPVRHTEPLNPNPFLHLRSITAPSRLLPTEWRL